MGCDEEYILYSGLVGDGWWVGSVRVWIVIDVHGIFSYYFDRVDRGEEGG